MAALVLAERIRDDGSFARTYIEEDGGGVRVRCDDGADGTLAIAIVGAVMERYGRPLEHEGEFGPDALALAGGATLQRMRFRARVDVIARDYLVLRVPGHAPLAALAADVAPPLEYLVRRRLRAV